MTTKQIKIRDNESGENFGAILLDNGDAVCGCCGNIWPKNELGDTWDIVKEYKNWVPISDEIMGDEG